jgi:allantoate deiminase
MKVCASRIRRFLDELAEFNATPGQGITRMSYSPQAHAARAWLCKQMEQAGLQVREDAIGNVIGTLPGTRADLPSVMIGSHFDTVPHGGAFDGAAGVIMALEIATLFNEQGLCPHYPLEVVALVEEEGASFERGLLASSAMAGHISSQMLESLHDSTGISAAQRMSEAGYAPQDVSSVVRPPESLKAFIELHIEQGPVLEQTGTDIGIVDVVVGMTQLSVTLTGKAGHAGTTPMDRRQDALLAASHIISQVGDLARLAGDATVATVGKLRVHPNGANVIPHQVVFSVDIRSRDEQKLRQVIDQTREAINQQANQGITAAVEQTLYIAPTPMASEIVHSLEQQCDRLGYSRRTMVSGAGHDAMVFAGLAPTGLIFVPSRDGLSHHPDEWTDAEQIAKGVEVIFHTVKAMTEAKNHD